MTRTITVHTGARLHFGPLSYLPSEGRHFGGVGLMIHQPGFDLNFKPAEEDDVRGDSPHLERARELVETIRARTPAEFQPPPCTVEISHVIPPHAGLGSGTQFGLALAAGMSRLAGEQDIPGELLAERTGRGRRSAIGLHGFIQGGLLVDAGKQRPDELGVLACRLAFPQHWRVLLMTPVSRRQGLSDVGEEHAFDRLDPMPSSTTDRLCRLVLTGILPAVVTEDFDGFSEAVHDYGRLVGQFFSVAQGGPYGDQQAEALVANLRQRSVRGVGQTSWGPTLFAFTASADHGRDLMEQLRTDPSVNELLGSVRLVAPLNSGAAVTEQEAAPLE